MEKISTKWIVSGIGVLMLVIFGWGAQNMYFHQDDLDWLLMAQMPIKEVMAMPVGDHINYLFRLLISTEWRLFGFNFPPYLAVSVMMHSIAIWLVYKLAKTTSNRVDLAAMTALLFSVNTNWTEVVLWVSGQTISITLIFVLVALLGIWHRRFAGLTLLLASWTSALSLGLLGATLLVYKHMRWKAIGALILVGLIYLLRGGVGTQIEVSLRWVTHVIVVAGLMPIHTVLGRLLIPFDVLELPRLVIVVGLMVWGLWKWRSHLMTIWQDSWSKLLLCHIALYYLIVALGRAQYGIGIMRAERYGYIGLALILLLGVRILRKVDLGRWKWVVIAIVCSQIVGLHVRARVYLERPQLLKDLVEEMRAGTVMANEEGEYLPRYVMGVDRLKYSDLRRLIND